MKNENPLWNSLNQLKPVFYYAACFSFIVNLLSLTIPIYMLQVFDRVLASQSADTLIYLTLIAIVALTIFAVLDAVRNRMAWLSGRWLEREWIPQLLPKAMKDVEAGQRYSQQCLQDVNFLRQYISVGSIYTLCDAVWLPLFLLVVFLIQPILGLVACTGAAVLFGIAWLHERLSRAPMKRASTAFSSANYFLASLMQQRENLSAMQRGGVVTEKLLGHFSQAAQMQNSSLKRADIMQSAARYVRLVTQLLILGVGAYLVISNQLTPGGMIAASIIGAKALLPFEQLLKAWRQSFSALDAFKRLCLFSETETSTVDCSDALTAAVKMENIFYLSEKDQHALLQDINLNVEVGELLVLVGPNGSGKTTLSRIIAGVLKPARGYVQLGSKHIGYLSQNNGLVSGTIKENIAGFIEAEDKKIQLAAQLVGADRMIQKLRNRYETNVDDVTFSKGQQQLICLARAFFQMPALIILDEPEAYLDQRGDAGLRRALHIAKRARSTVILTTQRPSLVETADRIVVLREGRIQRCGKPEVILPHLRPPAVEEKQDEQ